jgi:D-threo-aldose 1-dehydrogenase
MNRRTLGSTGLDVTVVCIGTSPLAGMPQSYGYDVGEDRGVATVEAVLRSAVNFLDTSNNYGAAGAGELRVGQAIRRCGGLPDGFVLATKVDPDPATGDFSGARVRASYAESLERLGLDRVPLLHLHDPERIAFEEATAPDGAVAALAALRSEGAVDFIGVAGGVVEEMRRYVDTGAFDVVLNHNRYTLLDRSAEVLYREARERGMGVINAAPYGGGMLAKGPGGQVRYAYRADEEMAARAARMQAACERSGVPLAAAALQFSLRSELVDSTVVGVSSPERVAETIELAALDIPSGLWDELDAL